MSWGSYNSDNPKLLTLIRELSSYSKLREIDSYLDLGCASGELTLEIARTVGARNIYGVDMDEEALNRASLNKEYTGGVLLEAQALGVPVIASRVGAVPEMMKDGETGFLVEPGDELELAKAIEILIGNHELRERFSSNAREFVKNFTLEPYPPNMKYLAKSPL